MPGVPDDHRSLPTADAEPGERKPYQTPAIEDLGTLAELTWGATGVNQDTVSIDAGSA